jgi:predicted RNase H-like nuclease
MALENVEVLHPRTSSPSTTRMRAVLGIDAAWTSAQPSGVALVAETSNGWHLLAVESSYQHFDALADDRLTREDRPRGSRPDARALLASAAKLCGRPVDLVAIDMPLAHVPITCRRASDNAVSRTYGARGCGTHTPSAARPGPISDALREGFELSGYPLLTSAIRPPGVIEVYPHPALVELARAPARLRYKASKVRSYWPSLDRAERHRLLLREWDEIVSMLDSEIVGVRAAMPTLADTPTGIELKAYEDGLDAIVCAWVAICALDGRAAPFGDDASAIWIPLPIETVGLSITAAAR